MLGLERTGGAERPATTETRFRIGSVSKSLTSVAIGRLVQDGQLDLDSPVQRYVPGFPEKRNAITVRQVAGHLAASGTMTRGNSRTGSTTPR